MFPVGSENLSARDEVMEVEAPQEGSRPILSCPTYFFTNLGGQAGDAPEAGTSTVGSPGESCWGECRVYSFMESCLCARPWELTMEQDRRVSRIMILMAWVEDT